MEINKAIEKIIFDIYDYFYKHGQYGAFGVAQTCFTLRTIYSYEKIESINDSNFQFFIPEIFKNTPLDETTKNLYIHKTFLRIILDLLNIGTTSKIYKYIAGAINKLAKREITKTDALPTDDFYVKVMQTFANKISREKRFIDPCVGTGKLLIGLNSNYLLGLENDKTYIEIAKANIFFSLGNKNATDNIKYENGLEYFGERNNINTYIFDPPLNVPYNIDSIPHYDSLIHQYSFRTKTIPSEYVFLHSVLLDKKSGVYPKESYADYICAFSSQFLTITNEKFKLNYKRYLIETSLQIIISSPNDNQGIGKIILVGQQLTSKKDYLYLVTPKTKNITHEQIEKIADICINDKFEQYNEKDFFEIAKIKRVQKSELAENNYVINMPVYEQGEKYVEIKNMPEVIESLENSNSKLKQTSDNLLALLNDLSNGIKHNEETSNEKSQIIEQKRTSKMQDLLNDYGHNYKENKKIVNINFNTIADEPARIINIIDYLLKQKKLLTRSKRHFLSKKSIIKKYYYKNFVEYIKIVSNQEISKLSKDQQIFYEELITYYYNYVKYKKRNKKIL